MGVGVVGLLSRGLVRVLCWGVMELWGGSWMHGLVGSGAYGGGSGGAYGSGDYEGVPYEGVVLWGRWC